MIEDLIENYKKIINRKIRDVKRDEKKLLELMGLIEIREKRKKGKLTKEDVQRALNLLCWGSFAGCCSPVKECPWNMAVSEALGIDYKKLYEEKRKISMKFINEVLSGKDG